MANRTNDAINRSLLDEAVPTNPTKSQLRRMRIIEGAIRVMARAGIEEATFGAIAKASKSSRPLVVHYFPDKKSLLISAMRYIRLRLQQLAIAELSKHARSDAQLGAYVDSTFKWIEQLPDHARTWLLYYYYCGIDKDIFELNSALVKMGHERIEALVVRGMDQGVLASVNPTESAKLIQITITGALLAVLTEQLPCEISAFQASVRSQCLTLAGYRAV